jgi:hypothetical protein
MFLASIFGLISFIINPESFYRPKYKGPASLHNKIMVFAGLTIMIVFSGYFSYVVYKRNKLYSRSLKAKRRYDTTVDSLEGISIRPINGKGRSLLILKVDDAGKPVEQELELDIYIIYSDGSRSKKKSIVLSPSLYDNDYETTIDENASWPLDLRLECISKLNKPEEIYIDVEVACEKQLPSFPDIVRKYI